MAAGFATLTTSLTVLYHLGDQNGNARTAFGDYSGRLDQFLVGLPPGAAVGLVFLLSLLVVTFANTSIIGGLKAARHTKSIFTTIGWLGGVLLVAATVIGFVIVLQI